MTFVVTRYRVPVNYIFYEILNEIHHLTAGTGSGTIPVHRENCINIIVTNRHIWSSPLHWRHNGGDGVSNRRRHDCLLNRLLRRRSKKSSKPRVTVLCKGNSPVTGELPAQKASDTENVSIWWRHHGILQVCDVTSSVLSHGSKAFILKLSVHWLKSLKLCPFTSLKHAIGNLSRALRRSTPTNLSKCIMMTPSNGNIFRVIGHLCGEFTGPRWSPRTKASEAELWCFHWSASELTVE